jgi:prolyl oligopeptidase
VGSTYHGVTVTEDYRWLEDAQSNQTQSWTKAQDRRTRSYLEKLPFRDAVRQRVAEVLTTEPVRYDALRHAGPAYFALKWVAPLIRRGFVSEACEVDGAGGVEGFLGCAYR